LPSHILFITSSNLATNPRCLKEIRLALQLGYKVSVIKFAYNNWSQALEKDIELGLQEVKFYRISAERSPFFPWLVSTLLSAISNKICRFFKESGPLLAIAADKRTWLIQRGVEKNRLAPDFIIAHNPAAFWPAYHLARKGKIPFATDVEDYHPGETHDKARVDIMEGLMKKILPHATYVSFASRLIQQQTVEKIPAIKSPFVIDNCFEKDEFLFTDGDVEETTLQLVWFSQNINHSRGLELLLPVIAQFENLVTVTLIGNLKDDFREILSPFSSFIKILEPMPQPTLHHLLSNFDVGLAIEPAKDLNNNILLSNKIWSYFQSGLFILASSTQGQKKFLHEQALHGRLFDFNEVDSLKKAIIYLLENKVAIRSQKKERFERARRFSWENESKRLIQAWREIL
jgi:glycosyltransferase involved in cell wall biosynthesis